MAAAGCEREFPWCRALEYFAGSPSGGDQVRTKTLLRMALLLAVAAALSGQRDDAAYFSLMSSGTFGSAGAPSVSLSAWNLDSLEFRVYRIKDPEKFFGQLEDPHEFGGMAPRPPRTRSLLENIRSWKRGLKAHIRRSLRAQFTES